MPALYRWSVRTARQSPPSDILALALLHCDACERADGCSGSKMPVAISSVIGVKQTIWRQCFDLDGK